MVLHRDISENNLMIYRPGETDRIPDEVREQYFVHSASQAPELNEAQSSHGILNDFDMASMRKQDGTIASDNDRHHHLTGTRPFMALDLLKTKSVTKPTVHLYRHDLESFFYILVWAAARYKYSTGATLAVRELDDWSGEKAFLLKSGFYMTQIRTEVKAKYCLPEFSDLWDAWINPLFRMFREGLQEADSATDQEWTDYDYSTFNGKITFEKFMAAIGKTPRAFDPDNDTA